MQYRNKMIDLLANLSIDQRMGLMLNNTFQAGLDALDPDAPCYVQDRAIQECIYFGLRNMLTAMRLFDVVLNCSEVDRI